MPWKPWMLWKPLEACSGWLLRQNSLYEIPAEKPLLTFSQEEGTMSTDPLIPFWVPIDHHDSRCKAEWEGNENVKIKRNLHIVFI